MKSKQVTIWFNGPVRMESDGDYVKVTGQPCSENMNMNSDHSSDSDEEKINRIKDEVLAKIDLDNLEIPEEYYYSCLPLCLLDAIYSIGSNYTSTKNVVKRYSDKLNIKEFRETKNGEAPFIEQYKIDDFLKTNDSIINHKPINENGVELDGNVNNLADFVENHQLTSTKSGILKAEAAIQCALVLQEGGIQTIKDFNEKADLIEEDFKNVTGQQSGISFSYLKMLCGDENTIKPDRHILRFLSRTLGYDVEKEEAEKLICSAVNQLKKQYPKVTPRALDYAIWNMMRNESK